MEPKSGPLMHWSWPFSSGVAGTHALCTPLKLGENVVSPQCQGCCSSFLAGSSLSSLPPPKVQLWFYYPCWKTPLAPTPSREAQFPGVDFKALCSLASAASPPYSPIFTLGCLWHTGLAVIPRTCHMCFCLHTFWTTARTTFFSSTPLLFPV